MGKREQTKEERQRQVISRLSNENKKLRQENKMLRARVMELESTVENLQLQIEELKRIIFGGPKKENKREADDEDLARAKGSNERRSPESYRRPIPAKQEITETKYYKLNKCPECNNCLSDIKRVNRYKEDIFAIEEWPDVLKQVKKEIIETGYCAKCENRVIARKISPQMVSLGENLKQFVCFAIIVLRLSYQQVGDFLETTTRIKISDGEISKILEKQAGELEPVFERLKEKIRGQPAAHYDETSWKVQKDYQGNHAWVMAGVRSAEAIFLLGRSRGKGNVDELRGESNIKQVAITDDYGAYKNSFETHALCWAHPHRKLRDLKNSDNLSEGKQKHCQREYERFAELYGEVREVVESKFEEKKRGKIKKELMRKFEKVACPHRLDPLRLKRIKKRLLEQKECYFVCITHRDVPADNNKAERALRHLVLKRKNSYGSKTQAGADKMSVLYSVLLSAWWKSKQAFFREYSQSFPGI